MWFSCIRVQGYAGSEPLPHGGGQVKSTVLAHSFCLVTSAQTSDWPYS